MHVQKDLLDSYIFRWSNKIPVGRYLNLEVYSALIEYENRKAKPVHYFIQIVDYDHSIILFRLLITTTLRINNKNEFLKYQCI